MNVVNISLFSFLMCSAFWFGFIVLLWAYIAKGQTGNGALGLIMVLMLPLWGGYIPYLIVVYAAIWLKILALILAIIGFIVTHKLQKDIGKAMQNWH